ncbi:MAG: hypothetical protein ACOY16_04890 [Chloroflexota bacterium]
MRFQKMTLSIFALFVALLLSWGLFSLTRAQAVRAEKPQGYPPSSRSETKSDPTVSSDKSMTYQPPPPSSYDFRKVPREGNQPFSERTILSGESLLSGKNIRGDRFFSPSAIDADPPMVGEADFVVCMSSHRVWGMADPLSVVTITINAEQMGAHQSDHRGYFWTPLYDDTGHNPGLTAGDEVSIFQDGVKLDDLILKQVNGEIDAQNDTVSGRIEGVSSAISVTIYTAVGEPTQTSYSQTVSTDASGNFSADFSGVYDWLTWDEGVVVYKDGNIEVHKHVYAKPAIMVRPAPYNWVFGMTEPNMPVTVTLYESDGTTVKEQINLEAGGPPPGFFFTAFTTDIVEDDVVRAEYGAGVVMSLTIHELTMTLDPVNDRITGETEPNAEVRGQIDSLTPSGNKSFTPSTTADSSGVYTLELSGLLDLMPGDTAAVLVADAEGDDLNMRGFAPSVVVHQTWDDVFGRGAETVGAAVEGSPITLTIYSAASDEVFEFTSTLDWYGDYLFSSQDFDMPDLQTGDVVTVTGEFSAWQASVTVKSITATADFDADSISGEVDPPSNRVELFGEYYRGNLYPAGGQFGFYVNASSPFEAAPAGFDVHNDLGVEISHRDASEHSNRIYMNTGGFGVYPFFNGLSGVLPPAGSAYTITLSDSGANVKAQITGNSPDPIGEIGWLDFWSSGVVMEAGDGVRVESSAGFDQSIQVPEVIAYADLDTDTVYGTAPPNSLLWIDAPNDGDGFVASKSDGTFIVYLGELQNVYGDGEIDAGDFIGVNYVNENRNWHYYPVIWPAVRVNYGHNWVGGDYEAGHSFNITVTNSSGFIKGIANVISEYGRGWSAPGFETTEDDWTYQVPDIMPGDYVYIHGDDGYDNVIRIGEISGELDFDENTINGEIHAGWITSDEVGIRCEAWVENGPDGIDTSTSPQGGSYSCDFDDVDYDLLAGDDVAVMYVEPDLDRVMNIFPDVKPNLRIEKWADGNPAEGANIAFKIRIFNDGNGVAENTILTDTLEGMTYISDTSGMPATVESITGGERVMINLGDVPTQSMRTIMLFAQIDASEGERITNTAQLVTENAYEEGDEGELVSSWSAEVAGLDSDFNIAKWAWTNEPVAGYDYVYEVNVCNNGSSNSKSVTVTDTLPLSSTVVSWWGQQPGWSEVSRSDHQVVLSRPSMGGGQCSQINLRAHLDENARQGDTLTNLAVVFSEGDANEDDNETMMEHSVGGPRMFTSENLSLRKGWRWGSYVPGGEINYDIEYQNQGNLPADNVSITSTLPEHTYFIMARYEDEYNRIGVIPSVIRDDIVVFDLGTLDSGYHGKFVVTLGIRWEASAGDVLTHSAEISQMPHEFATEDNQLRWVDSVNDYGANLSVDKQTYRWISEDQLEWEIHIHNIGTEILNDIFITDIYPLSTNFTEWYKGHGGNVDVTHLEDQHQVVVWVEEIIPKETANVVLKFNLDGSVIGERGLAFTNQLSAPWDGDVDLSDNENQATAYSGADIFIEKWLSGGKLEPGEMVTFTVKFGNHSFSPWNSDESFDSKITDTLPEKMTFIRAAAPWDYDEDWGPNELPGNGFEWGWGPMWAESTWYFQIVAQIEDTLWVGEVVTNTIRAYSDNPDEVELSWENNVCEVPMLIVDPNLTRLFLPIILR